MAAFTPMANITLGAAQTSITFSSISGTFRDLYLVLTPVGATGTGNQPLIKVNNDATAANYAGTVLRANGTTATGVNVNAYNNGLTTALTATNTGNNDIFYDFFIQDYATTDKHKNFLIRSNCASSAVEMNASKWSSTSAITSLVIVNVNGLSFGTGTTATLYGVSA